MYAESLGCKVYFEHAGKGKPLLILHGWGVSSELYRGLFMRVAGSREARIIDFPGFGLSAMPPGVWGTEEYAEMVSGLLAGWGIGTTDILAHSFGGRVALRMARAYPEKVGRMVLTGAAGIRLKRKPPLGKRILSTCGKVAGNLGRPGRWLKNRIYATIGSPDYLKAGALRPVFVKVVNEDLTPILPEVRHKVLLLWGEKDRDTPLEAARIMNAGLTNSKLSVMQGCGHYPFMDDAELFYSHIRDFLEL